MVFNPVGGMRLKHFFFWLPCLTGPIVLGRTEDVSSASLGDGLSFISGVAATVVVGAFILIFRRRRGRSHAPAQAHHLGTVDGAGVGFSQDGLLDKAGELSRFGGWRLNLNTENLIWTSGVYKIFELPEDFETTLQDMLAFFPEESAQKLKAGIQEVSLHGGVLELEFEAVTAREKTRWVRITGRREEASVGGDAFLFGYIQDVTERKAFEIKLQQQHFFLQTMIDHLPVAVFVKDARGDDFGKYMLWNKTCEELTGLKKVDALEKSIFDFLAKDEANIIDEIERRAFTNAEVIDIAEETVNSRYHGQRVMHTIKVPVFDEHGEPAYLLGISDDITEQKHVQEETRRLALKAEAANRSKSEFLANMSHEIRTPMNGVVGAAEMLLDADLSPDQRDWVITIQQSGRALLGILNDILDFSKIEAGKLEMEVVPFDLETIGREVIALLKPGSEEKGIYLELIRRGDFPGTLKGDPGRIRQVLINLTGNAIKFTREGSVAIEIWADEPSETSVLVHLLVRDTGIGISDQALDAIFEKFNQGDNSTTRQYGGTGLGLAITKNLIEMMGGSISVKSELEKGSEFHVSIPMAYEKAELWTGDADSMGGDYNLKEGLRVLLVEDNPVNQKVARAMIARMGCEVVVAPNGREAWHLLSAGDTPFSLVFMDCQMPVMDGYEATRLIRSSAGGVNAIPIIAMTAGAMKGDRERCLEVGMNDYIAKPISKRSVRNMLLKYQ